MDGVFVAYHNTKQIFGFQYIPLSEMDARLFGEDAVGDAVFERCLLLLEVVLEEATRELPHQVCPLYEVLFYVWLIILLTSPYVLPRKNPNANTF